MSEHKNHAHSKGHGHGEHRASSGRKGLHRDWRLWTVVLLMLAGMAVYVLTFDESLSPFRGGVEEETPAAAP